MGWVIFGFVLVIAVEGFIGISKNYRRPRIERQRTTRVSAPWYAYALGIYAATRKGKR